LKKENKFLQEPTFQFGSPKHRFFTRFEPFYKMRTPPVHWYKQYETQCDYSKLKTENILQNSLEAFQNCKSSVEKYSHLPELEKTKLEELKVLFKVAVSNALQISMLLKDFNKQGWEQKKVNISYQIQPHYPVITLK